MKDLQFKVGDTTNQVWGLYALWGDESQQDSGMLPTKQRSLPS